MAKYLLMASYTGEAWAAQVKNPQNRVELVRPVFERMGGSMELAYGSFGESDIVIIMDMPDNISAAAISIAFAAGGAVTNIKTIPLMEMDDLLAALGKAGGAQYSPPSS